MYSKRLQYLFKQQKIVTDDELLLMNGVEVISSINHATNKEFFIAVMDNNTNNFRITQEAFDMLIGCDPTSKKLYVQWLLKIITRLLKVKNYELIQRILSEDLETISDSLINFDNLKKTKRFKILSKSNHNITHIKDASDINQYELPEELHGAVFPFKENTAEGLELRLKLVAKSRNALIEFEDQNFLVYIPLTLQASVVFDGLATWCTTRPKNGMFKHYTAKKRPNGTPSRLYVVMNKKTNELFQIHFETNQINNSYNRNSPSTFISDFLKKSIGLTNYFKFVLIENIRWSNYSLTSRYISAIKSFNFIDALINMYPDNQESIEFSGINTPHLKLKYFSELKILTLTHLHMDEVPEMDFGEKLEIISFYGNNIKEFPMDLLKLKHIKSINLAKNKITDIPEGIKYLGPEYNGPLINLSISENNLSEASKKYLKQLLPGVNVVV